MAKQHLNTELLEQKKQQLENHKNNINDYLIQIKEEYMKLISNDLWLGHRSDVFFESLKAYWDTGVDPSFIGPVALDQMGIIGQINSDFAAMISFITGAIDKSLGKDTEAANEIESTVGEMPNIEGGPGVAGANATVGNNETPAPTTPTPQTTQPETTSPQNGSSSNDTVPPATPSTNGTPRNVSVGPFYPDENKGENNYVAGLNYQIIDTNGNPAKDNIGKETISVNGKDYQVYTYDDPETPEKEHYIIGALLEDGKNSKPTGNVYTIDYGNGDVYEFVDLDTNAKTKNSNERTPDDAMDTYVDILSVRGHAYNNVGIESSEPVKITNTGKTVSKK